MTRAAVILAGGAGTRLRPLSSDENPKQFLQLFQGESLLQKAHQRLRALVPPENIFVSTNERYTAKVQEHLPDLPTQNILAEPSRRNTAPAIALCTFYLQHRYGDPVVAFLPSDHYIGDEETFRTTLERAFSFAEDREALVTIGIRPTEPHTGYGYMELGERAGEGVSRIARFTEKPSRERAAEFLRLGRYVWNGGMFVWRASVFRRELNEHAPQIAGVSLESYDAMPAISIDYALMERSSSVVTVDPVEFGWSDVGSFEALERVGVSIPEEIKRRAV